MKRVIRASLDIAPLAGHAGGTSAERVKAAAVRTGLAPEDAERQSEQLESIARMVRSLDAERLRLRCDTLEATGQFEVRARRYTEEQAKVALFRVKAA
eukprot:7437439-Alexandrium_andersonii.AAC.1